MKTIQKLSGSCHCGEVKWEYPLSLESVTACNCTLCRKYGALWAYGYLEEGIKVSGPSKPYERGSRINKYHFCLNCGCITHYQANKKNESGQTRIAINIRMVSSPDKNLNFTH